MNDLIEFWRLVYVLIPFFIFISCNVERNNVIPVLETMIVTDVTQTTAKSGGIITSNSGANITAKGACWSINANPTVSDPHSSDGSGDEVFESMLTDLIPDNYYHVRAFATNIAGTAYGDEKTFRTSLNYINRADNS